MKFQNKYKRDMEKITVSPAVADAILNNQIKGRAKKSVLRVVALAACLCIVFSSVVTVSLVALFNGGIIGNPILTGTDPSLKNNNNATVPLVGVQSYKEIYSTLSEKVANGARYGYDGRFMFAEYALAEDSITGGVSKPTESNKADKPDYSDTNNQVQGVQEADIIKTDGKFIYTTSATQYYYNYYDESNSKEPNKSFVYIVSAEDGKLDPVSKIEIRASKEKPYQIIEILLYEDTLVIIKQSQVYHYNNNKLPGAPSDILFGKIFESSYYYYNYNECYTAAEIYDITDRTAPVFKGELYQSGSYKESRMVGKNLYLISNYYINPTANENKPESFIPVVSTYDKEDLIPATSIYFANDENISVYGANYHVITGIDISQPASHKSSKSMLCSNVQSVYANDSSIYLTLSARNQYQLYNFENKLDDYKVGSNVNITNKTDIYRLGINDGEVTFAASGTVNGSPINQFAMDEYNGIFRIATTINSVDYIVREKTRTVTDTSKLAKLESVTSEDVYQNQNEETYKYLEWSQSNESFSNVYTLDLNLKQEGVLTGLGKTERIYSVRYDGDIGYVVTFRQTDPLYAIDLSDAKQPKILSELKIPGFSNYMHPYGEGLLFGLGMDADENGRVQGMKLSMFDVSDKADVTEMAIKKLSTNTYSDAQYNHKAILVNAKKNLIGFPVYDYSSWNSYNNDFCKYYLFSYEDGKFVQKAILKPDFDVKEAKYYNSMRGIYIGDFAYMIIQDVGIISYNMNKYEKVDTIKFDF